MAPSRSSRRAPGPWAGVAVLMSCLFSALVAAAEAPRVEVVAPEADLGRVAPGAKVEGVFEIHNRGSAALELTPEAGAPITSVRGVESKIAPGGSAHVTVALDTARIVGPVSVPLRVKTNDPDKPELSLTIKLDVRPFVHANPGQERFITVQGEVEGTIGHLLWSDDARDFVVREVVSPQPALRVGFREATEAERRKELPGKQWRVESTLASMAPVGPLTGEVIVRIDHPGQPEVRIPVSGFVRPVFAVTPADAKFGEISRGSGRRWKLLIKNFGSKPADLTGVTSDIAALHTSIQPIEPGRTYNVLISLAEDAGLGPFEGTFEIQTSSAVSPVLRVPASGTVVEASTSQPSSAATAIP